ncbi:MAG: OmpA family protein [Duncaniella sp.]|nr:OmpA family protein [Duncaniella sp.]
MTRRLRHNILTVMFIFAGSLIAQAKDAYVDPYKGYEEAIFMDMELEQNILTPKVMSGEHKAVSSHMSRLGHQLADKGYIVDMMRDNEVVVVTIPSDDLFMPNDTLLSPSAPGKLSQVVNLLADPEMFKVVYAVHTDNTGSEIYNQELSHRRNNSIYDWLLGRVSEDLIVIPYEMGDTDPAEPNDSRKGRAANRRVEFYLIPGPKMITQAHKGLLK